MLPTSANSQEQRCASISSFTRFRVGAGRRAALPQARGFLFPENRKPQGMLALLRPAQRPSRSPWCSSHTGERAQRPAAERPAAVSAAMQKPLQRTARWSAGTTLLRVIFSLGCDNISRILRPVSPASADAGCPCRVAEGWERRRSVSGQAWRQTPEKSWGANDAHRRYRRQSDEGS